MALSIIWMNFTNIINDLPAFSPYTRVEETTIIFLLDVFLMLLESVQYYLHKYVDSPQPYSHLEKVKYIRHLQVQFYLNRAKNILDKMCCVTIRFTLRLIVVI